MKRLKTIVVGTDFSACARHALAQAVRMSQWNNAALHVLHAIDGFAVRELAEATRQPLAQVVEGAMRHAQQQWSEHVAGLALNPPPVCEAVVGVPIDELLKKVRAVSADLLVVGSNGESGTQPGAGVLAAKCLRKAPTKVIRGERSWPWHRQVCAPGGRPPADPGFARPVRSELRAARFHGRAAAARGAVLGVDDQAMNRTPASSLCRSGAGGRVLRTRMAANARGQAGQGERAPDRIKPSSPWPHACCSR